MGYWAIVIRQLTIPVVSMVAAWFLCPWRPGRPANFSTAIPGLKYAVKVYSNFSIGYLTRSIDKVLLGKFYGSELLGNYDRAYHLSSVPAGQLLTPLHSVALATLSRLQNDKERFLVYYTKAASMVAFIGTIAAVCLTLSAKDLIPLLLGQEWVDAGSVVMAFGPGIAAMLVYGTHSWLHLSLGTPGRWFRWNLVDAVLSIAAFIIAAPFGAVAMAIAYSARSFILIFPALWYAGQPVSLNIVTLIRSIGVYFGDGIFVVIFWLYLFVAWLPFNEWLTGFKPLYRVAVTVSISSISYIAMVIIFQRSFASIRDIFSLIKIMLSHKKTEDIA
jgi:PST family polysaccharide transporter